MGACSTASYTRRWGTSAFPTTGRLIPFLVYAPIMAIVWRGLPLVRPWKRVGASRLIAYPQTILPVAGSPYWPWVSLPLSVH